MFYSPEIRSPKVEGRKKSEVEEQDAANPGLLSIASWIERGLPLINTPLQRGVGDGRGVGTAAAVYPPP